MVHYHLLLVQWPSLWYTTLFYWPTGYLYDTLPSSIDPLTDPMVHYYFLLTNWLSLRYTIIFYRPNGPLYGTHQSSIGRPLALPMERYYLLLAHLPIPMDTTISTGPLAVSVEYYYLLLAHWLSLRYTIIFYWPTGPPYCTQLSYTDPLTPMRLCGTLLSSTGPLAISLVHYHLLLAHWLSLWYITTFYWPTGYLYSTLPSSTGPLAISMIQFYFLYDYCILQAHWLSL